MWESRALYSKYNSTVHAIFAVVFGLGAIAAVVVSVVQGGENAVPQLGFAVLAALACGVFIRLSRLRVVLRADHVELVNPLRTHRIRWSEIDDIQAFVYSGWRVRVWSQGKARVAFGLSQYSKYTPARSDDNVDRDAPKWLSSGYRELRECWQSRRGLL